MIKHNDVALLCKHIYLHLSLRGKEWKQMVKAVDLLATKYQLMELKQIVTVLIEVDLQLWVARVERQGVVVGICDDVVAKALVKLQCLLRGVFTLIQQPIHARVGVEVGPFPTLLRAKVAVGVEYLRTTKRLWFGKTINATQPVSALLTVLLAASASGSPWLPLR